ncbi:MAG: sugar transferase [Verrucomicrobia bacterium]|nr:sugar transferase [Verrucomicrobiota bacterium]
MNLFSSKHRASRDPIVPRSGLEPASRLDDRVTAGGQSPVIPFPFNGCAGRDCVLPSGSEELVPPFGARTTTRHQSLPLWEYEELAGLGASAGADSEIPAWKRSLDFVCILLSLPVCLPLMICIALWIKIVSPGPVFYRQERVGYRGRRFMILKFRTMKVNVETLSHERHLEQLMQANCPMTKLDAGDPRIIRGGRILRAMGLDELPQLLNVLSGEMSLVGPRPCTVPEFERYQPWQRERVDAPPGLTGYWQVNGKNKTTFIEMINMDIFYARNMSLGMDLEIILRTFPALLTQVVDTRSKKRARKEDEKPVLERS